MGTLPWATVGGLTPRPWTLYPTWRRLGGQQSLLLAWGLYVEAASETSKYRTPIQSDRIRWCKSNPSMTWELNFSWRMQKFLCQEKNRSFSCKDFLLVENMSLPLPCSRKILSSSPPSPRGTLFSFFLYYSLANVSLNHMVSYIFFIKVIGVRLCEFDTCTDRDAYVCRKTKTRNVLDGNLDNLWISKLPHTTH